MYEVREFPFSKGLIPIPREWLISGNMAISALKISYPFPKYSRGIWLVSREFPIPGKFQFFSKIRPKNWRKNLIRYII